MAPVVNWDEIEETNFDALPAGKYSVVILGIQKETSKSGKDMWAIQWKVEEGGFANRRVYQYWVFDGKSLSYVKGYLDALDVDVSQAFDTDELLASGELIGAPAVLSLTVRAATAQYPESNDVQAVLPANSPVKEEATAEASTGGPRQFFS